MNNILENFIENPESPINNFNLATYYENNKHYAGAISYYLRCAEFSSDKRMDSILNIDLVYESLIRLFICFKNLGGRNYTEEGWLLHAVSLIPTRPEAYFLLSRMYEINKDWQEAYTMATLGENLIECDDKKLRTNVEYPGKYGFAFEKAVSAWWIGLYDESIYLFRQLDKNPNMTDVHTKAVKNNLSNLSNNWKAPILYDSSLYEHLRV